jgi:hypothetical protein
MKAWPMLVAALLVASCSKDTTAPTPTMTGQWSGSFSSNGVATALSMTLQETGGNITGSGNLSAPGVAIAITVAGTHAHPNVSLTLSATGFSPINLSGQYTDTRTITATLNGSGYVNQPATITRAP